VATWCAFEVPFEHFVSACQFEYAAADAFAAVAGGIMSTKWLLRV